MQKTLSQFLIFFISCTLAACAALSGSDQTAQESGEGTPERIEVPHNPFYDYKPFRNKDFEIRHMTLEVAFNWDKNEVYGKSRLQIQTSNRPQKRLVIDAKAFDIHKLEASIVDSLLPSSYNYNGYQITIDFDTLLAPRQIFELSLAYTARPDSVVHMSQVKDPEKNKGLYFIKPERYSPKGYQIWTQGEPEANSVWFPTIDAPNQRFTHELFITVGDSMKTLSNGKLIYSQYDEHNNRTDYWRMDQAHAPYLVMLAVGDFVVVDDQWNDLPLTYYVEPAYESSARHIFGRTPEMLTFFTEKLGIDFPWDKYAQIIVRDFVSGGMENTTATVYFEELLMDSTSLTDDNWDDIIAHELMHHWFGNLVTCQDWSQISLNEAFAEYAEYLWNEHKHGKHEADYKLIEMLEYFIGEQLDNPQPIIRYKYEYPDDLFDAFTYQKGAIVLHMLRYYLGDTLFFDALNQYLRTHANKQVTLDDLRKAFEQQTGKDLKWFFYQWFLQNQLPVVKIDYTWEQNSLWVKLRQDIDAQSGFLFQIPLSFSFFDEQGSSISTHTFFLKHQSDSIRIDLDKIPAFFYPDPDLSALVIFDHDKSITDYLMQLQYAPHFYYRYEAAVFLSEHFEGAKQKETKPSYYEEYINLLTHLADDDFWLFRQFFMDEYYSKGDDESLFVEKLKNLAVNDPVSTIRADALAYMNLMDQETFTPYYIAAIDDSSAAVQATALYGLISADKSTNQITDIIERFKESRNPEVILILADYYAGNFEYDKLGWFINRLPVLSPQYLYYFLPLMGQLVFQSNEDTQRKVLEILTYLAKYHQNRNLRLTAYNSLAFLDLIEDIQQIMNEIKSSEKDPEIRAQMKY